MKVWRISRSVAVAVAAPVAITVVIPIAVAAPVPPAIAVPCLALDVLLQAGDPVIDVARLVRIQDVAGRLAELALDLPRILAEAPSLAIAEDVAAVEDVDLALDRIDPILQAADLAVVAVAVTRRTIARAVSGRAVAGRAEANADIAVDLRRSGSGDGQCLSSGGEGNQNCTHRCSPSSG